MSKHIFSFLSSEFVSHLSKTNANALKNHLGSIKKLLNKRLKELPTLDPLQFYRILETHLSLLCFVQGLKNLLQNPHLLTMMASPPSETESTDKITLSDINEATLLADIQYKIKKFQDNLN